MATTPKVPQGIVEAAKEAAKVINNAKVTTTKVTQTANEVLGTGEKTLYYLILEVEGKEKMVVNVGEKTHDKVLELTK